MAKPKILVAGIGCGYGGTETVVSRFIEELSDRFEFDTFSDVPLKQIQYIEKDNRIIPMVAKRKNPIQYARDIRIFFRKHADEYQGLWFNANSFSNITPLVLADKMGIEKRIVHFHNTEVLGNSINRILTNIHREEVNRIASTKIACSKEAGLFAYGINSGFEIINNSFQISDFQYDEEARNAVRMEMGLTDSFVIGTTGRLAKQKNQSYLINLLPELLKEKPNTKFVIVGEGPLERSFKKQVVALGVKNKVIFTGARTDISRILSAFDVFAFPSLFEGLGISLVEAQANALPCVISDQIPSRAIVSKSVLIEPLSNREAWVKSLLSSSRETFKFSKKIMEFDMSTCAPRLANYFSL